MDRTDPGLRDKNQPDKEHVLIILGSIKRASKDLQYLPAFIARSPIPTARAILELGREIDLAFETDPGLSKLSELLSDLKRVLDELEKSQGLGLRPLIRRQTRYFRITQIASDIEDEVQGYLDKDIVLSLIRSLNQSDVGEDAKLQALTAFEDRVEEGFHMGLQDLILKSKVFSILESMLCDPGSPKAVREQCACAIVGLVKFNRNVFVGLVMMGPMIGALISIGSCRSIRSLSSLVRLIRSPLIDEMYVHGEVSRVVDLIESSDHDTGLSSLECLCEIAYYGRKEVVESMLEHSVIEKLMELQRSQGIENESPFGNCVAGFAIQVEVGEGLTQPEKTEVKLEILRRIKAASTSEAEAASVSAEVLWGSSPLSF